MADALSLSQIQACEVGSESTQVTVGILCPVVLHALPMCFSKEGNLTVAEGNIPKPCLRIIPAACSSPRSAFTLEGADAPGGEHSGNHNKEIVMLRQLPVSYCFGASGEFLCGFLSLANS